MARRRPDPPVMTEAARQYYEDLDERAALQRFVDQPGQWVDTTPPEVKKRQEEAWERLKTQLEEDKQTSIQ